VPDSRAVKEAVAQLREALDLLEAAVVPTEDKPKQPREEIPPTPFPWDVHAAAEYLGFSESWVNKHMAEFKRQGVFRQFGKSRKAPLRTNKRLLDAWLESFNDEDDAA
jgi:hypothetical protein